MPRYMVAITEIVEYLVPVTAPDADAAAEIGERKIVRTRNRDKWCVGVQARECDGVNPVAATARRKAKISASEINDTPDYLKPLLGA